MAGPLERATDVAADSGDDPAEFLLPVAPAAALRHDALDVEAGLL